MSRGKLFAPLFATAVIVAAGLVIAVGSIAIADPPKGQGSSIPPELKLPPGWTQADMQACIAAGTPGKMHELLAKSVGTWRGDVTMWMYPGAEPVTSDCTVTVTSIMDGRFTRVEHAGEIPGMGPYRGLGINGFDNVSQKFVSTWIDNHSTSLASGAGKLTDDGKVLTWNYTFSCPVTQKPATMRQVETFTGPDAKTLEMFMTDPQSGKEYKMMSIEFHRQEGGR